MADITLYMAPGTCARVASIALEEAGLEFETRVVRFMKGEHKSPTYTKLNPKGKVPTLFVDGETLTENVAIVTWLNERFPEARLMPPATSTLERARQLADLCFCASTLHPLVTRIRMPHFFATEDVARAVWEKGCASMTDYFDLIEHRLEHRSWWYRESWSAMDAYLYWVFWRVAGADFDVSPYPRYSDHASRMERRPSVVRALAREAEAQKQLEAEGLAFTPLKLE